MKYLLPTLALLFPGGLRPVTEAPASVTIVTA